MSISFDEIAWHDAVLRSLTLDRAQPGIRDEIALVVIDSEHRAFDLCFKDCYEAQLSMNFGVIAEETVRDAVRAQESESLDRLRREWSKGGVDLSEVEQFEIRTNSTDSLIRILAKSCTVKPRPALE